MSCTVLTDMLLRLLEKEEENGYVPVKESIWIGNFNEVTDGLVDDDSQRGPRRAK